MDRLVVAGVADLDEARVLPSTLEPRSATRGYSCARSLILGFLTQIRILSSLLSTIASSANRADGTATYKVKLRRVAASELGKERISNSRFSLTRHPAGA